MDRAVDALEEAGKDGASHIKEQMRTFCLHTSIKGVPRAMKTGNYFLKVVWSIGVLSLLGKWLFYFLGLTPTEVKKSLLSVCFLVGDLIFCTVSCMVTVTWNGGRTHLKRIMERC